MQILLGILIGGFIVIYLMNLSFQHIINMILIWLFKIPVKILESIDKYSVEPKRKLQVKKELSIFDDIDKKYPVVKSEPVAYPKMLEVSKDKAIEEPKPEKPVKCDVSTTRTTDGKSYLTFENDAKVKEWLAKNDQLKIID